MKRAFFAMFMLLSVSSIGFAQYSDKQLYEAYLTKDMAVWSHFLNSSKWESATDSIRLRILNCEYGYIPYLNSINQTDSALLYYERFLNHLEEQENYIGKAQYNSFISGAYAYACMLGKNHMVYGIKSKKAADNAMKADSLNPMSLYARGNVYFYSPSFVGGDKEKALQCFHRAEQLIESGTTYRYNWIYPALQLNLAQCYEKMGNKSRAVEQCRYILSLHPTFLYVKEEYLPSLLSK